MNPSNSDGERRPGTVWAYGMVATFSWMECQSVPGGHSEQWWGAVHILVMLKSYPPEFLLGALWNTGIVHLPMPTHMPVLGQLLIT